MAADHDNDHRVGFRPVRDEVDETLSIEGDFPQWLSGTLLRNGPGTWHAGRQPLNHWFDGFAMLRRFRIDGGDGEVAYRNRFLDSGAYTYAREHGELGYREFATDPPTGPLGRLGRLRRLRSPNFTDNACVDVCRVGDRYLATTESPLVTEIDPRSLESGRRFEFGGFADTYTVHPHYDFDRGELVGYGTSFGGSESGYTLYSIPDDTEDVSVIGEVESDPPGYVHSFALTPNYIVLAEPPFVPSRRRLLTGSSVIDGYEWQPERGSRFHVVDRESGDVLARHRVAPFFCFHHINAFEREREGGGDSDDGVGGQGEIVLDLAAFEDASVTEALSLRRLVSAEPSPPAAELRRYCLPAPGSSRRGVESETLYPGHVELPAIDYANRNTRDYRYAYGVSNRERPPESFQNQLVKVDVRERDAVTWDESYAYPGEPVFVPAPDRGDDADGRNEDDGVILSVTLDAGAERSFLLVLDAATFQERARAWCPHPIPFGFHGQFYADGEERPTRSMA